MWFEPCPLGRGRGQGEPHKAYILYFASTVFKSSDLQNVPRVI